MPYTYQEFLNDLKAIADDVESAGFDDTEETQQDEFICVEFNAIWEGR